MQASRRRIGMAWQMRKCDCCERDVSCSDWDSIYDCCFWCAWCKSLGQCFDPETQDPNDKHQTTCCHGKCMKEDV